ncbi:MAG: alanine racemase [Synergistaceae bacterium]|jgi:alanine racemase|nr:alanine racemase [Synergistaceae bacterium]
MRLRPTRLEVSLENYRHNYRAVRDYVRPAKVIAVVKADAYGMGVMPVVWALKREGADFFAVATPDEALELREAGVTDSILVLGASVYDAADVCVRMNLRSTLTDLRMAEALSKAASRWGRPAVVHLKVDSGLGRLGFLPLSVPTVAERLRALPGIELEGIFTHFSNTEGRDLTQTRRQFEVFSEVVAAVKKAGFPVKMVHCCNSGALRDGFSGMFQDAVRSGQILSGIIPCPECAEAVPVKSCFQLKTAVGLVRELPPGSGVSYGQTYITREAERVAVLPVGYADGFSRGFSNVGEVLIRGTRCPIRGVVCMDQCVVGVSHLQEVEVGDEAVLIGSQGGETITVTEAAAKLTALPLTIPAMFTARLPRVYV